MKLVFTHERSDAISDLLIYLYIKTQSTNGVFCDVHCQNYQMGIKQYIEKPVIYDGITFVHKVSKEFMVVHSRIESYQELILEGEEKDIKNFCHNAFEYAENRINNARMDDKLNIFHFDMCWVFLEGAQKRTLESLNLPKTQVNDIIKDISQFTCTETQEKYSNLSIPHSRTYMFYGPPGTGKTSLVKAIASEIDYNIGIVEFDCDMDDKSLKRAISRRPDNSIIVFEDIDCLFESRKKSDEQSTKVTFSGLLNTFDGVVTHKNLIVIFTTNHLDILDPAFKRRVDYFLKFDFATKTQVKNMYTRFYPEQMNKFDEFYEVIQHIKITPNILQKFFTKHLYDTIADYAEEMCSFARGESAVESMENLYT